MTSAWKRALADALEAADASFQDMRDDGVEKTVYLNDFFVLNTDIGPAFSYTHDEAVARTDGVPRAIRVVATPAIALFFLSRGLPFLPSRGWTRPGYRAGEAAGRGKGARRHDRMESEAITPEGAIQLIFCVPGCGQAETARTGRGS